MRINPYETSIIVRSRTVLSEKIVIPEGIIVKYGNNIFEFDKILSDDISFIPSLIENNNSINISKLIFKGNFVTNINIRRRSGSVFNRFTREQLFDFTESSVINMNTLPISVSLKIDDNSDTSIIDETPSYVRYNVGVRRFINYFINSIMMGCNNKKMNFTIKLDFYPISQLGIVTPHKIVIYPCEPTIKFSGDFKKLSGGTTIPFINPLFLCELIDRIINKKEQYSIIQKFDYIDGVIVGNDFYNSIGKFDVNQEFSHKKTRIIDGNIRKVTKDFVMIRKNFIGVMETTKIGDNMFVKYNNDPRTKTIKLLVQDGFVRYFELNNINGKNPVFDVDYYGVLEIINKIRNEVGDIKFDKIKEVVDLKSILSIVNLFQ